jgi:hypothetical protein
MIQVGDPGRENASRDLDPTPRFGVMQASSASKTARELFKKTLSKQPFAINEQRPSEF